MTDSNITGPTMLCATEAVKTPPMKIGKLSEDIVLPRAIPVVTMAVVAAFAVVGMLVGIAVGGVQGLIIGGTLSGFLGYITANYSPLRGESFLKWVALLASSKQKQLEVDGEPVVLYVGIARVLEPAAGQISLRPGSVEVNPVHYDERGVLRKNPLREAPQYVPPTEPAKENAVPKTAPDARGKKSEARAKPRKKKVLPSD